MGRVSRRDTVRRAATALDEVPDPGAPGLGPRVARRTTHAGPEATHDLSAVAVAPLRRTRRARLHGHGRPGRRRWEPAPFECIEASNGRRADQLMSSMVRRGLPARLPTGRNEPHERRLIARICAVLRRPDLVGPRSRAGAARLGGSSPCPPHLMRSSMPTGRWDARRPAGLCRRIRSIDGRGYGHKLSWCPGCGARSMREEERCLSSPDATS